MFALLPPNNCYLQLCGLSMVYLMRKRGVRRQDSHLASNLLLKNRAHIKAMSQLGNRPVLAAPSAPESAPEPSAKKLLPIRRSRIFYDEKFVKKAGLGQTHVLSHSSAVPTKSFARHLCRVVFQLGATGGRLHKRFRGFVDPMIQLTFNHSRLRYGFFLRIHCPLPSFRETGDGDGDEIVLDDILGRDLSYRELISHHTEHYQVKERERGNQRMLKKKCLFRFFGFFGRVCGDLFRNLFGVARKTFDCLDR